jgi:Retrotransposon gag protein/Zinc knuckle
MAQPHQLLQDAMQQNQLAKLPIWFGDPAKDAFRSEDWWQRFELAATAANWNWDQTRTFFMQALRGSALTWWNWLTKNTPVADINELRAAFLADYGRTAVARACVTQVKLLQKDKQSVRDFVCELQVKTDELELSVTPMPVLAADQILQNRPAGVPAIDAAHLPWLREQFRRIYYLGFNAYKGPMIRNLLIDGFLPAIRDEVLRANPPTYLEAIQVAKQAERDLDLKSSITRSNGHIQELEVDALNNHRRFPPTRGTSSHRGRGRPAPRTSQGSRDVPTCYYCNKRGHVQKDCYKRQRENGAYKQPPRGSVQEVGQETAEEQPPAQIEQPPIEQYAELSSITHLNW